MDLTERRSAELERVQRHPWEEARARFFLDVLARHHALFASARVLDIGAGDAHFARALVEKVPGAEVVAWDHAYTDQQIAELTRPRLTPTRDQPSTDAGGTFDVVLMLDVLEHIDDEAPLLEVARKSLRPGGRVLVSVPAWPTLLGPHDMRLRHRRRYLPEQARALLENNGLVLMESGGLFHSLLVPRALSVAIETRAGRGGFGGDGAGEVPEPLRTIAQAMLRADNMFSAAFSRVGMDVPGLSWWALCARGAA